MDAAVLGITIVFAYFLGSIPSAYLAGRLQGLDIRTAGSGNSGAANTLRVLGTRFAIPVLAADTGKGLLAVLALPLFVARLAWVIAGGTQLSNAGQHVATEVMQVLAGGGCILGHIFPVWLRFKGGKGVATGAGVVASLAPKAALLCLCVFVLMLAISRYVSLASISAAGILPVGYAALYQSDDFSVAVMVFCAAAAILVIFMHRRNILRLLNGTEARLGKT